MAYHTILAVMARPQDAAPLLAGAAALPAPESLHVIGCHGEPSQFIVLSAPIDVPDAGTIAALYEQAEQRMSEAETAFTQAAEKSGLSFEWRALRSPSGDSAVSALPSARTADLVLVRQCDREAGESSPADVEALLFESGRPVLFLPPSGMLASPVARVLIAWDGSREASRAVHDAMPFLKGAQSVTLVIVDPDRLPDIDAPLAGTDIAAHLSRHGVHAEIVTTSRDGGSTSDAILRQVKAVNADLVVMGAYTHQRLREWLFGGVTRSFLEKAPVATLMAR